MNFAHALQEVSHPTRTRQMCKQLPGTMCLNLSRHVRNILSFEVRNAFGADLEIVRVSKLRLSDFSEATAWDSLVSRYFKSLLPVGLWRESLWGHAFCLKSGKVITYFHRHRWKNTQNDEDVIVNLGTKIWKMRFCVGLLLPQVRRTDTILSTLYFAIMPRGVRV